MNFLRPDRLIFSGRRGSSLGLKRLERGVDCSPLSSAQVKKQRSLTSALLCHYNVDRVNSILCVIRLRDVGS